MIVWPAELPQRVLAAGYNESLGDGRLRTRMETGPMKVRRRYSSAPRPVAASFRVSPDGKARIERFWKEEIAGGSLPFWLPDQTHDGLVLLNEQGVPLFDEQGRLLANSAWWLVMAGDAVPNFTPLQRGMAYTAAFQLVIMP
ncbi:hypothetical protein SAMN02799631_04332 [Methylobacterium sp. 174MFSha1.1]|uniref:hypothetical protein n=1 Tax=Methylobacterium sp. 174MFSha1.1 TaxID=1502749 RepID=UPI0008E97949|nr:hypothetical protein [Methylobacterium sp. 174MFSha1.1]SFV05988.1 hypothetical protein SAMN02799631_04332 [Methylobacterium sp. 174MFSha1.1]